MVLSYLPQSFLPLCDYKINLLFQLQFSGTDLDQALFQPFPSEIVFQNYTPCEVYEVPLVLRNNDKVSIFAETAVPSWIYKKGLNKMGSFRILDKFLNLIDLGK